MPYRPWSLNCALLTLATFVSAVSAVSLAPSNVSTAVGTYTGRIELQTPSASGGQNLSELVPLTTDIFRTISQGLSGNLHYTTPESERNLTNTDIAYISCDNHDYTGFMSALQVLNQSMTAHNLTAVILYSTTSDYCRLDDASSLGQAFPILSMTNKEASAIVLNLTRASTFNPAQKFFVEVRRSRIGDWRNGDNNDSNGRPQNPLGPSPSTAVAMIILYSITGIITALFLVIIITGAVRAHRHPDRYGPRDTLGRPRQSRARGLGRAILDTLPIVKFGERDPPKPADVELGSTSETRGANSTDGDQAGVTSQQNQPVGTSPSSTQDAVPKSPVEQQSGIAAAEPSTTAVPAAGVTSNATPDEVLGCSICTDDFEKGQDIRVLPCDHKFHPECVDPWLLNVSGTCPLCRVDLRPTTTNASDSDSEQDPNGLAPPLEPEGEVSQRRRLALRDILSLRSRPNASAEERISALRRLREQRQNQSGDVADHASSNGSAEDVAAARRSRRISTRLSGVFGGRAGRRHGHDDVPVATAAAGTPAVPAPSASPAPSRLTEGPVAESATRQQ